MFMVRINSRPFYKISFDNLIIRMSKLYDTLRTGGTRDAPPLTSGTSFVRKTSKYWVHPDNITAVKIHVLKHLPVSLFLSKSGKMPDPAVTSVYFDNDSFDLYKGRLEKTQGAEALRMRWYGNMDQTEIFVERKTHHEDWTGDSSVKERFPIKEKHLNAFLSGEMTLDKAVSKLRESGSKSDKELDSMLNMAREVQASIESQGLKPTMRSFYNRTAFQLPGDARVRISLDTELTMIREDNYGHSRSGFNWRRMDCGTIAPFTHLPTEDVCPFKYAVLEVKLQTQSGATAPQWVQDLINSHLVEEVPKFSKFIHGVATLLEDRVSLLPFWLPQMDKDIRKAARVGSPMGARPMSLALSNSSRPQSGVFNERPQSEVYANRPQSGVFDARPQSGVFTARPQSRGFASRPMSGKTSNESESVELVMESDIDSTTETLAPNSPSKSFIFGNIRNASASSPLLPLSHLPQSKLNVEQTQFKKMSSPVKFKKWLPKFFDAANDGIDKEMNDKTIILPVRIEPKVFFANERTFLTWLQFCLILGSLALALFNFGEDVSVISGIVFVIVAMVFMGYSLYRYLWRGYMIRIKCMKSLICSCRALRRSIWTHCAGVFAVYMCCN